MNIYMKSIIRGRIGVIILLFKKNCGIPYSFLPSLFVNVEKQYQFEIYLCIKFSNNKSITSLPVSKQQIMIDHFFQDDPKL
jgi:hypothetical protein